MTFDLGHQLPPLVSLDDEHGEVFTRRWVVELILDLAGYTPDRDLAMTIAVEPSCGAGAFLGPMVERLLASCELHGRDVEKATSAIRAFDLLEANGELTRKRVTAQLVDAGVRQRGAEGLAVEWVTVGDFLLASHAEQSADFVLGNPPYVRLENVPADRNAAYRHACLTMRGRSDIFIGFIEMGLRLLKPDGSLGFIVADRWMRNQYGAALRAFVAEQFSVEAVIEMYDVDAFEDDVSAYPAVTVIRRQEQAKPIVASTTAAFGERAAEQLRKWSTKQTTNLFVGAYCVKMRGGTYRFQAQYLRRIRVPAIELVKASDRKGLASAFERRDVDAATAIAVRLYGIDALPASVTYTAESA